MKSTRISSLLAAASIAALAASVAASVASVPAAHRSTPKPKSGRRMRSPGVDFYPHNVSKEVEEWNRQVDLKKAAKKAANFQKRFGDPLGPLTVVSRTQPVPLSEHTGEAEQQSEPQKDMVRALALTGGSIG